MNTSLNNIRWPRSNVAGIFYLGIDCWDTSQGRQFPDTVCHSSWGSTTNFQTQCAIPSENLQPVSRHSVPFLLRIYNQFPGTECHYSWWSKTNHVSHSVIMVTDSVFVLINNSTTKLQTKSKWAMPDALFSLSNWLQTQITRVGHISTNNVQYKCSQAPLLTNRRTSCFHTCCVFFSD